MLLKQQYSTTTYNIEQVDWIVWAPHSRTVAADTYGKAFKAVIGLHEDSQRDI